MIEPNTNPAPAAAVAPRQKTNSAVVTRVIVIAAVLLLTLAAIAIGLPWASYRCRHVVIGEATVRGIVSKVGARIDGRVKSIEVEVGQHVSKGQVLLRLEDTHFQAALDKARGELQCAIKELESERAGIQQTRKRLALEIARVQGVTNKAAGDLRAQESILARCEKQYERVARLLTNGGAAQIEMDRVTGERDQARGMLDAKLGVLESAQASYEKAMNELDGVHVREQRLGVLDSQIAVARAKLAGAESDLEATVVRAPDDGRVLDRIVESGGSAKVGEPMISLWLGHPWVEAWVDERDLHKFKLGSPVEVSLDSSPAHKLSGRVEAIGLESDKQLQPNAIPTTLHAFVRQNAMVPVRVALEDENPRIQLGLSAMVGIRKESGGLGVEGPHVAKDQTHSGNPSIFPPK